MTNDPQQLDIANLSRYLEEHVPGFVGPVVAEKFSGGQSNPTFLLQTPIARYVLRRQPPGELLKSAHAVDREFRILTALSGSPVPVAHPYHLCEDRAVIGSLFYVMSFEEGRIFWNPALPDVSPSDRVVCYDAMLRTMAALHDVDVGSVGLVDYGRPGNYFERQIGVWTKQYRLAETERIDAMERLIEWLPSACPADAGRPSLVHGDFRLDNMMFEPHGYRVKAVLDWELVGRPFVFLHVPAAAGGCPNSRPRRTRPRRAWDPARTADGRALLRIAWPPADRKLALLSRIQLFPPCSHCARR